MIENGVTHRRVAPYHPSSNGLAERAVQTFKNGMKKLPGPLETRLSRFLFMYRITPQSTTESSPAQLMFGRPLRSRLDLILPDLSSRIEKKQEKIMERRPVGGTFCNGDRVYCREYSGKRKSWTPGVIEQKSGPLSYKVKLPDGRLLSRHVDQINSRTETWLYDSQEDYQFPVPASPQIATRVEPRQASPVNIPRRSSHVRQPPIRYDPCQ